MTTAWGGVLPDDDTHGDSFFYLLAAGAGALAGWVDIKVQDLLLTALLVMVPCMILGALRPSRPWRWALLVGIFVPFCNSSPFCFFGPSLTARKSSNRCWLFFLRQWGHMAVPSVVA